MPQIYQKIQKGLLIGACSFALAGCKEVLFSNLAETEANEMVAILAAAEIPASRDRDKDNIYSVLVSESNIPVATTLLRNEGYPKQKFESLGEVFSAEGIVGTPFEQQARYIHAMNQELSKTISSIEGVKSARVFVTAPAKDRYQKAPPPASASVMINYEAGFDAEAYVTKIKVLVAHSLPNLEYDSVAVALFKASGPTIQLREPPGAPTRIARAGILSGVDSAWVDALIHWLPATLGAFCITLSGLFFAFSRRLKSPRPVRTNPSRNSNTRDRGDC